MSIKHKKNIIWHISDIHIRNGVHQDILFAIEQLAARVKNSEAEVAIARQLVVIAGDVFESKNKFGQHDLECFHKMLEILKFVKILIIPGNHDYSGNDTPDNTLDLITAALMGIPLTRNNIFNFSRSGIHNIPNFENIEFHILSPIDDIEPSNKVDNKLVPIREPRHDVPIRVAVLHEPIKGCCLYGSGIVDLKARFEISDLEKYDLVLAGDIHKPQFMGAKKTIAYSGSLIQKNKGEDLKHGCIKWSINSTTRNITSEFIPFALNSAYLIILAKDDEIFYPKEDLYKDIKYLEFRYKNCSKEKLEEFIIKVREKYTKLNKVVNIDDKALVLGKSFHPVVPLGLPDNDPLSFQNSPTILLEIPDQIQLLNEMLVKDPFKNDILELHSRLSDKFTDDLEHIKHKWKLDYLYWSNIFCYGENNFIDFSSLEGINSIIGKNRTGKSSIIDILIFILYFHLFCIY